MAELDALNRAITEETDFTRTFSNPVCKQTYNSLPKIYGKKRKSKIITLHSLAKNNKESHSTIHHQYLSPNEEIQYSTERSRRTFSINNKLCSPKNHINCIKKNCACHAQMDSVSYNKKLKTARKVILPEIRKFDLEDLETHHKVTRTEFYQPSELSSLEKIVVENNGIEGRMQNKVGPSSQREGKQAKNVPNTKYKQKFKPIYNSKFDIEEQSEEERNTEEIRHKRPGIMNNHESNDGNNSRRYVTEQNDSSDKSRDSVSLSSFVFKNSKRQNTNYHSLNKSQRSQEEKLSRSRAKSILSNGLFRIPQQPQYKDYLKDYRPLAPEFSVKSLVSSKNFKIVKENKSVYFGEVNQESQKDGTGLMVSQKQIYQGEFKNNKKIIGYQRNVDGVYEGGFVNGLRSGEGRFKWNNGEVFQGNWEAGMKNGFGIWRSPKGDCYQGQWKNNRQNGQGTFKHRMSTYKGSFNNFLKHGYGEQIFANGDKYSGNYEHGKPHGKGRYQWHEGGYYEGMFFKGFREGKGRWVDQNGTVYQGQFKRDCKDGFGIQTFKSGEKFQGQFSEGVRLSGILTDREGTKIQIKGSQ